MDGEDGIDESINREVKIVDGASQALVRGLAKVGFVYDGFRSCAEALVPVAFLLTELHSHLQQQRAKSLGHAIECFLKLKRHDSFRIAIRDHGRSSLRITSLNMVPKIAASAIDIEADITAGTLTHQHQNSTPMFQRNDHAHGNVYPNPHSRAGVRAKRSGNVMKCLRKLR